MRPWWKYRYQLYGITYEADLRGVAVALVAVVGWLGFVCWLMRDEIGKPPPPRPVYIVPAPQATR